MLVLMHPGDYGACVAISQHDLPQLQLAFVIVYEDAGPYLLLTWN